MTALLSPERSYILEDRKPSHDQQGLSGTNDDTNGILEEKKAPATSRFGFACFNYINSIVGSGVIGMAYALSQAGFGLGILLLAGVALLTDYSLVLMVRAAHLSGRFTYQGITEAAFGRAGFLALTFLQFLYPFMAMVSYNVVVGDTVTKVLVRLLALPPTSLLSRREVVVGLATLLVTVPLCLVRDVARLAKASVLSVLFIFFIMVAIVHRYFTLSQTVPRDEDSWQFYNTGVIPAIGIMAFAFMCHHNVFLIYGSLEEASQARWDLMTHISVGTSFLIALVFGVAGYATFTSFSQGDLLENYCWTDDEMNFARIAFSATILLTFPIECMVTKSVVEQTSIGELHPYAWFIVVPIVTYLLSISTDCLGVVLEFNGVVSAVPLAFVLPALCYLKLSEGPSLSWEKGPALGLALFGLLVALVGLFQVVLREESHVCSHGQVMPYCHCNDTAPPRPSPTPTF